MDYFNLLEVQQSRQRHADLIAEAYNENRVVASLDPNPAHPSLLNRVLGVFKAAFARRGTVARNSARPA